MRIRIAQMLLVLLPAPQIYRYLCISWRFRVRYWKCGQVLEVRMKRRWRESEMRDSGSGEISALVAQLLALEQELEGRNEREKEERKLGRAWGVWLFGG